MIRDKQKGFTLIEVLIAMSIISLIAMTFFNFLNSSIRYNAKNEKDIQYLNIAQTEIENLREQIKSDTKDGFTSSDGTKIKDNNLKADYDEYGLEINLRPDGELYTIEVYVEPKYNYFSNRSVRLITKVFGG
ncbi:MAG: PulJ/GspJ family protein [Peptostreptococcaceae bacterium]